MLSIHHLPPGLGLTSFFFMLLELPKILLLEALESFRLSLEPITPGSYTSYLFFFVGPSFESSGIISP